MSARFQIKYQGNVIGEAALEELQLQVDRGELTPLHKLSQDGRTWHYASEFPELFEDSFALDRNAADPIRDEPKAKRQARPEDLEWFAMVADQKYGPWQYEQVVEYIQTDRLSPSDVVWHDGLDDWTAIEHALPQESKRYLQRRQQEERKRQKEEHKRLKEERRQRRRRPVIPPEQKSRSVLAVASVVLSVIWCFGLASIAGIIIGFLALIDIVAARGYRTGVGLAMMGMLLGVIGIGLALLFFSVNGYSIPWIQRS